MKILQVHLKKELDLSALDGLSQMRPKVVFAFGGSKFFEDLQLGKRLKQKLPDATIVGCSSAGEIVNDPAVYDDTLVVTGVADDDTSIFLATARIGKAENSFSAGHALGKDLAAHEVGSVFVLAPGLAVNGSALANGLAAILGSNVTVTGGLAGDGARFQSTYTLFNDTVTSDVAVAIGFNSCVMKVSYGSAGGWEPFGLERKVTRAVSNVLYELDGKSALQLYKEYLGDKARELPSSGLLYPLCMLKDGIAPLENGSLSGGLIRTILNVDEKEGSLILAGDIPEGSTVRLMHAKTEGLVKGAVQASVQATGSIPYKDANLGILISCVGRKLVMGHDVDEEVGAVKSTLGPACVVTGFYSYGEICANNQNDKRPCLHNQTMTITRIGTT